MNEDFSLKTYEMTILQHCIGKNLIKLFSAEKPDDGEFWKPVFLTFDDITIKLQNILTTANYFDDTEDCGRLSVELASNYPVSDDTKYIKNVNQNVKDVRLLINRISFPSQDNMEPYKFIYPRALIFELSDRALTIERGWRFQEYLKIRLQDINQLHLVDEFDEWYDPDEDDAKPELTQEVILLKDYQK